MSDREELLSIAEQAIAEGDEITAHKAMDMIDSLDNAKSTPKKFEFILKFDSEKDAIAYAESIGATEFKPIEDSIPQKYSSELISDKRNSMEIVPEKQEISKRKLLFSYLF